MEAPTLNFPRMTRMLHRMKDVTPAELSRMTVDAALKDAEAQKGPERQQRTVQAAKLAAHLNVPLAVAAGRRA